MRADTTTDARRVAPEPGRENSLLRRWNGVLTAELQQVSGAFGLGRVPARLRPETITRSVCGFCSTGCSLDVHLQNGVAVNLTPTLEHPVNLGMACPKGWEALTPLAAPDRATAPLLRQPDGSFQPITWDDAIGRFVERFKSIMARHGPESVAFLSTGQICTEEMALLGALFKFGMGGLDCDSNTRQCMATAHVAYKQSLGFDAPPFTYADFEASDVLVFVGANPCIAHPIMWQRVLQNPHRPAIIVIDPRRTETAANATQHLALRPKSDLTLLYGIAHLLVRNGWVDHAFIERSTTNFSAFAEFIQQFTPDKVADETALGIDQLHSLAETIHKGKAVSFWWTMGVNQSHEATRAAQAMINLALMTGNIGRPGTGANSITGQCNAMGSRLFSNITSLFGGRDFLDPGHRAQVAGVLGLPLDRIPSRNSLAYDQIVQRAEAGHLKGLWVIATNPSHSWIDQNSFNRIAPQLEFLVVQDMFATTETARLAHLVLPASGWGEKEGTFINSERRISVAKRVSRAPGVALSDFGIFRLIAEAWGCGAMFRDWSSPEAVFQILKKLSAGTPCDITGIEDYGHLDECGGIQWPWPAAGPSAGTNAQNRSADIPVRSNVRPNMGLGFFRNPGTSDQAADKKLHAPTVAPHGIRSSPAPERRLFEDGRFFHPDGRAKFIFDAPRPAAEPPDPDFPLVLLTGRGTSAQWHTNTRTGKSAVLRALYPANAYVEVNPSDAARLNLAPHTRVTVVSRRARVQCIAFVTLTVPAGQVFIPMHYAEANQLTRADFDPHSRQPSYKHCAVRLEKANPVPKARR